MEHEKITFIKAANGIIVEIQEKNWDGHSVQRKLFIKGDAFSNYEDNRNLILEALQFAFEGYI